MTIADDYVDDLLDRCWVTDYSRKSKQKAKKMAHDFQTGDIVRKPNGSRHIRLDQVYGTSAYGRYTHTGLSTGRLDTRNLVRVNEEVEQKGNGTMKGKLFKVTVKVLPARPRNFASGGAYEG